MAAVVGVAAGPANVTVAGAMTMGPTLGDGLGLGGGLTVTVSVPVCVDELLTVNVLVPTLMPCGVNEIVEPESAPMATAGGLGEASVNVPP